MLVENIFTLDTSSIKVGPGAIAEIGYEAARLGIGRAMVITDPAVAGLEFFSRAIAGLKASGVETDVFDEVQVEPTDTSMQHAVAAAQASGCDGFVSIGGGSSMDTAKVANLYAVFPAEFDTYVNQPIGGGAPVPGQLRPHIAVPTTAGTGSETTGVAIFDYAELNAKTGIAHRALRPTVGIIDPAATATLPPMVAAASGLDVLSHALESLTAIPFRRREAPSDPGMRPAYQGANPISDIWSNASIGLVGENIVTAIENPADSGGPPADDAGGSLRRHWFWQRRGPSPARDVLPGLEHGPQLPAGRISARQAHNPARNFGGAQFAGGISLDRLSRPGQATWKRPGSWGRTWPGSKNAMPARCWPTPSSP